MTTHLRRTIRIGVLLALLTGLVTSALGVLPAAAAPSAPTGLSPNGSSVSGNPVLEWEHATGAASYTVEVATSSSFDTLLYTVSTTNRRATPHTQLPTGPLWWRVRSVATSGTSAWSVRRR